MFSNFLAAHFGVVPSWPLSYHFHIYFLFFFHFFISKVCRRHLFNCMLRKPRNQLRKSCGLKEREREKKRERNLSVSISRDYITIFFPFSTLNMPCRVRSYIIPLNHLITYRAERKKGKTGWYNLVGRKKFHMSRILRYIYVCMFDDYDIIHSLLPLSLSLN